MCWGRGGSSDARPPPRTVICDNGGAGVKFGVLGVDATPWRCGVRRGCLAAVEASCSAETAWGDVERVWARILNEELPDGVGPQVTGPTAVTLASDATAASTFGTAASSVGWTGSDSMLDARGLSSTSSLPGPTPTVPADWCVLSTLPSALAEPKSRVARSLAIAEALKKTGGQLFEQLGVDRVYVAHSALLAMAAARRATGVVVDCGYTGTTITPIHEGRAVHTAITRLPVGGRALTSVVQHELAGRGFADATVAFAEDVKHRRGRVACNIAAAATPPPDIPPYKLWNGRTVDLGLAAYAVGEALFDPLRYTGRPAPALHDAICDAVAQCPVDVAPAVCKNIVLTGGAAMLPGLAERLTRELAPLAPPAAAPVVRVPQGHAATHVYRGACVVAGRPEFGDMCVTAAEYAEVGVRAFFEKCL